jgi:YHS domain-containing protein
MEGPLQAEPVELPTAEGAGEEGTASAEVKFINPVCGIAVSTANALHVERYAGIAYYFCCDGCRTTFLKDPEKYAAIHQNSVGAVPGGRHSIY